MNRQSVLLMVLGGTLSFGQVEHTKAVLPADQVIQYHLHETPSDPATPVEYRIFLDLNAVDSGHGQVAWEITKIRLEKMDNGVRVSLWTEDYPAVSTSDGYWWVAHVDLMNPAIPEFVLPPYVSGTAVECSATTEDLVYDLQGKAYVTPPGGAPYGTTGALNYTFTKQGEPDPDKDGDDDDVELPDVPPGTDPPYCS